MIDLIDRQAAIAIIRSLYPSMPIMPKNREWWEEKYEPFIETEKALKILPSAHPEIIRCKDCEHYEDGLCRRWKYAHVTAEDSFCSEADMRGEADE